MKHKYRILMLFLVVLAVTFGAKARSDENKFRLKPGARGKICLECHSDFQDKLKMQYVHTPVKIGECVGCHSPHTSNYGKNLAAPENKICFTCHPDIIPDGAKSTHKVVVEGKCVNCHDPHASNQPFHLLRAGNEVCFACHKDIAQQVASSKVKHPPVQDSCLNCHDPHASMKSTHLLKDEVPGLCKTCHQTSNPIFLSQHMNMPVGEANCVMCHNPHGSDQKGMLYNNVHPPVASRMCTQCHQGPDSKTPLALRSPVFDLCKGCHNDMINTTLAKTQVHWPFLRKDGCLSCHNPHASPEKGLLKAPKIKLCGRCHADTIKRQQRSQTKHPPVAEGNCTACHEPHSSNNSFLLNAASPIDLCGKCHDSQKHATHPVGVKYKDPRNPNKTLTCLSCHRAHGTDYKRMIPFPTVTELCVQCHT